MKSYGIAIVGFGTVGTGVVRGLLENGELLAARLGAALDLRGVADIDIETDRGISVPPGLLTTDVEGLIDDPDVDVVVELVGGTGFAKTFIERALAQGKPVVTANKALLAKHGPELFAMADAHGTEIYFGASVGGGIPIIRALREGLIANHIESIAGIVNGTSNYILSRMEEDALEFDAALAEATAMGFAEADPSLDVDGHDTAHKAVLLTTLAFGMHVPLESVQVQGIRGISKLDVAYGQDMGYRIKLLAIIRRSEDQVEVSVRPTMVPRQHMLASVSGVYNAIMVQGDLTGNTLYYGRGAGAAPTASTVLGDVADIVKNLRGGGGARQCGVPLTDTAVSLIDWRQTEARYYIRLSLLDEANSFARILAILGGHGISIASVLQIEVNAGDYVPVVVLTHRCSEASCEVAIKEVEALDVVTDVPVRFRIEE